MSFVDFAELYSDEFIKLYENGLITPLEFVKTFKSLPSSYFQIKVRMIFKFIKMFVEKGLGDKEILENILGDRELAETIVSTEPYQFDFPVVLPENGSGKIVEGFVFESDKSYTNVPKAMEGIKILENILETKLVVIFSDDFSGNSFMLSLYIAIRTGGKIRKLFPKLIFTGAFTKALVPEPTDHVDVKHEISKKLGRRLVTIEEIDDLNNLVMFFMKDKKDVPFYFSVRSDRDSALSEFRNFCNDVSSFLDLKFNGNMLDKVFERSTWLFWESELSSQDFVIAADEIIDLLTEETFGKDTVLHIAIKGPSALAFIVGLKLKPYRELVFYHYNSGKYSPVLDLRENPRMIVERIRYESFEKIQFETYDDSLIGCQDSEVAVLIDMAGQNAIDEVRMFLRENGICAKLLHITHKDSGNIPVGDWSKEVREIKTLLDRVGKKVIYHIFLSCPVPLAFGLGLSMKEDTHKVKLYSYSRGEYHLVFSNV